MDEPFLGFIAAFAFQRIPTGWLPCDGRLLQISQYSALYSLLGTFYGGDGRTTFALPDLRGRVLMGCGTGGMLPTNLAHGAQTAITTKQLGYYGGTETTAFVLNSNNIPAHTHTATATGSGSLTGSVTAKMNISTDAAQTGDPVNNYLAADSGGGTMIYNTGSTAGSTLNANAISVDSSKLAISLTGVSVTIQPSGAVNPQSVNLGNLPPYLPVNYCMAVVGLYPNFD